MKRDKIQIIIKAAIPLLILCGCYGVNKIVNAEANSSEKLVVVNEDNSNLSSFDGYLEITNKEKFGYMEGLRKNLGFINDDELLVSIGLTKEQYDNKYPKVEDDLNEELHDAEYYREEDKKEKMKVNDELGELYKLNLSTLEKERVNMNYRNIFSKVSPKVKKLTFHTDESDLYVYDHIEKSTKKYSNEGVYPEMSAVFSEDGNCIMYTGLYNGLRPRVYNIEKDEMKDFNLKSETLDAFPGSFYSENGEEIYFRGSEQNDIADPLKDNKDKVGTREGIYKYNTITEESEEVLVLPYMTGEERREDSALELEYEYVVLDGGKRLLVNAKIEGVWGIYIYEVEENKFHLMCQYEADEYMMGYHDLFEVSPDQTKIIYRVPNGENSYKLYAANIHENNFYNRTLIEDDVVMIDYLYVSGFVQWNEESNKIIYTESDDESKLEYGDFLDKNEMNIVTFK